MGEDSFYRMTAFEVAVGWIFGFEEPVGVETDDLSARDAFDQVVLEALRAVGPTYVAFSGGRDSSVVLAVAVDIAERYGFDLPVPVTRRYPGVDAVDESEWQEIVIRHLGVNEWEKVTHGEHDDLLGESARRSLRRFGLLWPPTVHLLEPLLVATAGGTVLTGEGGDEMFGPRRITPLAGLIRRNVTPRRAAAVAALKEMTPRPVRRRLVRSELESETRHPWLTADARKCLLRCMERDQMAEPLNWGKSVGRVPYSRASTLGLHNQGLVGQTREVTFIHPFLDPSFSRSWAREGGALGYAGRTAATKYLYEGLLPDQVLARRAKARFNQAYIREPTRSFAARWTGEGVDPAVTNWEALRREWLSPEPHGSTIGLLHAAWLHDQEKDG